MILLVSLGALSLLVLALFSKLSARSWKITRLCAWLVMRALLAQGIFLLVLTVGLLGAAAAMTDFFATREAAVSATALGFPVPEVIIRGVEEALHISPVYRDIDYCESINRLPESSIGRLKLASMLADLLRRSSADQLLLFFLCSAFEGIDALFHLLLNGFIVIVSHFGAVYGPLEVESPAAPLRQ